MIKKIAIYGGAFDPPHVGHLNLIKHLGCMEGIDEVWLMPCGDREDKKLLLPMEKRFALMRAIFKQFPQIKVSEEEILLSKALQKPIHTYDLLKELKKKYAEAKFYFVFGADILHTIHLWGSWEKLLTENAFIVFHRKGFHFLEEKLPQESRIVEIDLPDISSTAIKRVIRS
jgi:nicotinate-nucleotide adenylyltransferase